MARHTPGRSTPTSTRRRCVKCGEIQERYRCGGWAPWPNGPECSKNAENIRLARAALDLVRAGLISQKQYDSIRDQLDPNYYWMVE